MSQPHQFTIRVYYEDTDAGGVVYHSNYLNFTERARSEMLREMGADQTALRLDDNLIFVVGRMDCRFLKPAFLDDLDQLLIGPFFLMAELYFRFGWLPSLNAKISSMAQDKRQKIQDE